MKNLALYLTINYPNKATFFEVLDVIEQKGIGFVEIGVPVTNPFLDGQVIKSSQEKVIDSINHEEIHDTLELMRKRYTFKIILMTYYEGVKRYAIDELSPSLYDGLLCVDKELDPKGYPGLVHTFTGDMEQDVLIKRLNDSSEFIYVISGTGKTGEFATLPTEYVDVIPVIKAHSKLPVLVGFGIKNKSDVETVIKNGADGAVIGSEFLHRLNEKGVLGIKEYIHTLCS